MDFVGEIEDRLVEARRSPSRPSAMRFFSEALRLCEQWAQTEKGTEPAMKSSSILRELAYEEPGPARRANLWAKALGNLQRIQPDRAPCQYRIGSIDCGLHTRPCCPCYYGY